MLSLLSVPVDFKEVYTANVRRFHVNPNWTMKQFIETITPHLSREFDLDQDMLEIVEAGQYKNNIPPERAPALVENDDNIRLKDNWGIKLKVSFYIRRKDVLHPVNLNIPTINECPICYETVSLYSRYNCFHRICSCCFERCQTANYTICPFCRQP